MAAEEFTFEREDANGEVHKVEFTDEGDQRIAAFVADFFGGHGITGVRWVDEEPVAYIDGLSDIQRELLEATEEGIDEPRE
jgi:hypothetical protein